MPDQNPISSSSSAGSLQGKKSHSTGSPFHPSGSEGQAGQAGFAPLPDEQSSPTGGTPFADTGKKTIAISREDIEKFGIAEEFVRKNPALIDLILRTESMKDEERKYWFQLLPIMSEEQIKKLQNILQNERDQLEELDKKYEAEVAKLNSDNAPKWKAEDAIVKHRKIEAAEKKDQEQEKGDEADILNQLENL